MNINLGAPYEALIEKLIERGYAGSKSEVIRQALKTYEREIREEEVQLVNKGIEFELQEMKLSKRKPKTLEQLKKKYGL